jgi:hypothetical protein
MRFWGWNGVAAAAVAAWTLAPGGIASAQNAKVQAACRDKLRPAVQACVRKLVQERGGSPQQFVERCRQAQAGAFRNCVTEAMAKTAPSRPVQPKSAQEAPIDLSKVQLSRTPGFAAPPRTIADITAILDQEKPDPEKVAAWRRTADAELTGKTTESKAYFERSEARAAWPHRRSHRRRPQGARAYPEQGQPGRLLPTCARRWPCSSVVPANTSKPFKSRRRCWPTPTRAGVKAGSFTPGG